MPYWRLSTRYVYDEIKKLKSWLADTFSITRFVGLLAKKAYLAIDPETLSETAVETGIEPGRAPGGACRDVRRHRLEDPIQLLAISKHELNALTMRRRQTLGMDARAFVARPKQLILGHKLVLAQKLVRPGRCKQGARGAVALDDLQGPEGRVPATTKGVAPPDIDPCVDISVSDPRQLGRLGD